MAYLLRLRPPWNEKRNNLSHRRFANSTFPIKDDVASSLANGIDDLRGLLLASRKHLGDSDRGRGREQLICLKPLGRDVFRSECRPSGHPTIPSYYPTWDSRPVTMDSPAQIDRCGVFTPYRRYGCGRSLLSRGIYSRGSPTFGSDVIEGLARPRHPGGALLHGRPGPPGDNYPERSSLTCRRAETTGQRWR